MRRITTLLLFLLLSSRLFGQMEVRINKVSDDSIEVVFPENMNLEMGKNYEFIYRTNITKKDRLYENFEGELLYDGKRVSFNFNYHEFGFDVSRKIQKGTSKILIQKMIYIKGTKFVVRLDDRLITRYEVNKLNRSTKISIELVSDTKDVKDIEVGKPILIYWMNNPGVNRKIMLMNDNKAYFDLSKDPLFVKGRSKDETDAVVIALPQVYMYLSPLLAERFIERTYIVSWED